MSAPKLLDLLTDGSIPRDRNMRLLAGAEQWDEWYHEAPPIARFYATAEPRPNMIFGPTIVVKDETLHPREYRLEECR
jgi:hypothetical protein